MSQRSLVVLVSIFVMSVLVACTPAAPAANQETAANQPAAEEAPPAEEAPAQEVSESTESESGEEAMYAIDTAASTLVWMGSKPIGSSETGTIEIVEGQMTFEGSQFVSGSFVIDMTTISPTGLGEDMTARLTKHLSSDEFFGVETYSTSSLALKSAEPTDVDNQYLVTADLTIKETTKEITFNTDVTVEEGTLTATADIVFDRAEFDVRYGSGSFFDDLGDDLISDDIEMAVMLVATRAS